jgi:DNA adenine methylase
MGVDLFSELDDITSYSKDTILRPPIKYPGSKFGSLEHILPYLPYRKLYCEPFGGSAAVLIARKPSSIEVYNDRYGGLVTFFKCLRDREQELEDALNKFLYSREDFIWCKKTWESCEDELDRAVRWYYMHQCSWGSMERNWGRSKVSNQARAFFNNLPNLGNISKRIRNVQIENRDWHDCLRDYDGEDSVFYVDPPYIDTYDGTYKNELSHSEHKKLLRVIFECEGFVALSGFDNPVYDDYPWDNKIVWTHYSGIEGLVGNKEHIGKVNEGKGSQVQEVLWIKE